jgi:hypothetical protein
MQIRLVVESITLQPIPNQSGAIYGPTLGISRNMSLGPGIENQTTGGGNLNGSANTALLLGQAGTAAQRIAVARRPPNSGNYCGIV